MYNNEYIITQLLDKENDTYEDLKHKNKKLRELIIKVSKQLDILYTKYENIKINAENEKKILLEKLEKISSNYKLYAESYKENIKTKKEEENENCEEVKEEKEEKEKIKEEENKEDEKENEENKEVEKDRRRKERGGKERRRK